MSDYIIIRVCTLAGLLLIARGSARTHVMLSFLGEILIAAEIMLLLWMINFTLILGGIVEIIAVLLVLRGNINAGKHFITLGLLMGAIVLCISAAQQVLMALHFYDFIMSDIIGWFGVGLTLLVRLSIEKPKNQS